MYGLPPQIPGIVMERARVGTMLNHISGQQISLKNWWGSATDDSPLLAYERLIDAVRLAVELAYTRDGDAVGLYAAKARGDERMAFSFLVDFLRAATRRDKLMPQWWNPQHDVALFRLAFVEKGDFYIYHAVEVSDVRKKWGYKTTKLLMVLATTVYGEGGLRFMHDNLLHNACKLYLGETPQRETGFDDGIGQPCRYGIDCKRPDCWFQHPRIQMPLIKEKKTERRRGGEFCSTTNMRDHILQMVGTETKLRKYYRTYGNGLGIGMRTQMIRAQKELQEIVDTTGEPFAAYLLGKIWAEDHIPMFGKTKSSKVRKAQTLKLWTESALAGNAYAMTGLALTHRDAGHMPTAVHWWKRALEHAEFPEAAYDLGVAYGLNETPGSDAVPINYEEAAKYYSMVVDMDLGYMKVTAEEMARSEVGVPLSRHILDESPSNNEQLGFQKLAETNLLCMEKYLANPSAAPLENQTEIAPLVEDLSCVCLLCGRQQRIGEKPMLKCSQCHTASYCNSICQRGHWPTHKPQCTGVDG